MADRLILDTGPIIALARADALDVVGRLPLDLVSPNEVRLELEDGVRGGRPSIAPLWLRFVALAAPVDAVARAELGSGEAAVIQLALTEKIEVVAIDERKGRRAALAAGLRVTGTLGLLGRAKELGIVSAVRPIVVRLRSSDAGWFDDELLARFLAALGE